MLNFTLTLTLPLRGEGIIERLWGKGSVPFQVVQFNGDGG